jgi:hypothetical protein
LAWWLALITVIGIRKGIDVVVWVDGVKMDDEAMKVQRS